VLAQVGALFRLTGEGLLSTLFPAECRLCNEPLLSVARLPVCNTCLADIQPFKFPVCDRCSEALPSVGQGTCTACKNAPPPFAAAKAFGTYDGNLRGLIHLLKYQGVRTAATALAKSTASVIAAHAAQLGEKPLIVPIPLHRAKYRARGFNQAEEIAAQLKKLTGFELYRYALVRKRNTESQTGMTAHQRRENVRGAFAARKRALRDLSGRNIILVDDVMTTGATAAECARVLRRAGAKQVFVVTAARVTSQAVMQINPQAIAAGA
jgi:ComF family protein